MRVATLLLAAISLILGAGTLRADDLRFSATLSVADRAAAGLAKLSSDQVAVIDALVRRDSATRARLSTRDEAATATSGLFSQRISAEERKTSGLATLAATEVAQLDNFVDRYQGAKFARTLLAPPSYLSRNPRLTPTERKTEREIHGTFSLSYGMGSGGYSEKTGSMVLTMEDPQRGYSIAVGYSESHIKGGNGYYRDPFYDPLRTLPSTTDPVRP
jgi:hypothetical protein